MMAEDVIALSVGVLIGVLIGGLAVWLWHRAHRTPADDADMQDWQIDLRRSAVVGDLAQQTYIAHCKLVRRRADWHTESLMRRKMFRELALEMLEKLGAS